MIGVLPLSLYGSIRQPKLVQKLSFGCSSHAVMSLDWMICLLSFLLLLDLREAGDTPLLLLSTPLQSLTCAVIRVCASAAAPVSLLYLSCRVHRR